MYQHPGVYIEHVPSNALAIEAASTSVTAIIGHTRRGKAVGTGDTDADPMFISSLGQYVSRFGPADGSAGGIKNLSDKADAMGMAVNAYFANGGTKAYIVPVDGGGGASATVSLKVGSGAQSAANSAKLTFTDKGVWANNLLVELRATAAGDAYEIIVGTWVLDADGTTKKFDTVIETISGFSLVEADLPATKKAIDATSNLFTVEFGASAHTGGFTAKDTDTTAGGTDTSAPKIDAYKNALSALEDYRDVSILLLPDVRDLTPANTQNPIYQAAITHAEKTQNRMVIVDPEDVNIPDPKTAKEKVFTNSPYAALYYPWMTYANPHFDAETAADLPASFDRPPSAIAAGMWARIDGTRGVWKAPAGLEAGVRGAIGPKRLIGNAAQDNLNEWGVNCIRSIVGPTVIWGARTTATKAKPQYRYISVRRTQNMIGESLYNALQAVVFEPNDHKLWGGLRASVGNFMDGLHRAGAFQGEKASDAYFVNCGLGSTMTQGDIDAGIVRVAVGFAPLKPAEFVVVQISQKVGQTA